MVVQEKLLENQEQFLAQQKARWLDHVEREQRDILRKQEQTEREKGNVTTNYST